ncbi:putative myc-type, basic helix-loop-helix (bHLH) domain-containing protein [Lupinus albus]|uniref:Putative myc-type, basic helix-loop-helix (BHLH) domain-containing protein n=1 Tax=Lupinus albus TaxID=3870 RepID=A0A6A4NPL5_LUPAL|nr:putative myc-type, basic helix-loop-helix (bHLH) domain-containing protein [Lupinus albus]
MASEQNIDDSTNSDISNHKKRRKITHNNQPFDLYSPNLIVWSSQSQQQIYSSNLVQALRRSPPSPAARHVRDTADRILARAAKGRTRWSRAILASPRWKLQRNKLKKVKKASNGLKKTGITGGDRKRKRRLPAVEKKARVLSRLVPGCKKVSFQNLLEEVSDYISALEMQVRAMTALTQLLDGGMVS